METSSNSGPAELPRWENITPEHLVPAIKRSGELFDSSSWKCSKITSKYCYAVLHPKEVDASSLAPYKDSLEQYRMIIGPSADKQLEELCRIGTPPALFKGFLDAFRKGLEAEIQARFDEVLLIARSNAETLNIHPVEWVKALLQILIRNESESTKRWIKEVCDKQQDQSDTKSVSTFEDRIFWKNWRAPRLIIMQPSGNTPYDPATEWMREDEARTASLLESLSGRFIQFLEIKLNHIAGDASVKLAQDGEVFKVPQPVRSQQAESPPSVGQAAPVSTGPVEQSPRPPKSGDTSIPWETIEITFLSDHRVQIQKGKAKETLNYAEFGFEDGRSGKPSMAWELLLKLAKERGMIRDSRAAGQPWPKVEKRIQEIRRILRDYFGQTSDPLPYVEGTGYRARFKVSCGPSFKT